MMLAAYLKRKARQAARRAAVSVLIHAVEVTQKRAQGRTWRLNVLNSGLWIDLGKAQARILEGLHKRLARLS